ncbi:hypothetical protein EJ04DRAFT_8064 [Polyplosphaeria fusca]|uniref:Uncharacterized protein n=1 Tax=Polyplosphaeria fusca TaxID=682080 RepID=A0A9P4R950_9PLEO|nr:hypothetical protein EJ04DRAFT_8064 [Polyplosphaeria fusca]
MVTVAGEEDRATQKGHGDEGALGDAIVVWYVTSRRRESRTPGWDYRGRDSELFCSLARQCHRFPALLTVLVAVRIDVGPGLDCGLDQDLGGGSLLGGDPSLSPSSSSNDSIARVQAGPSFVVVVVGWRPQPVSVKVHLVVQDDFDDIVSVTVQETR